MIRGGSILDPHTMKMSANEALVIKDGLVSATNDISDADVELDASGQFLDARLYRRPRPLSASNIKLRPAFSVDRSSIWHCDGEAESRNPRARIYYGA